MQSIRIGTDPAFRYLLRLGDTCLILGQRICEWSGHAPILEEDIALSNMALDLIGQARAVLTHAGAIDGRGHDEDQLAFLRNEPDYFNVTMAELPRGDFPSPRCAMRCWRRCSNTCGSACSTPATASWPPLRAKPSRKRVTTSSTMATGSRAWATAPPSRTAACKRPWTRCGPTPPSGSAPTRSMKRPWPAAWAHAGPICVKTG